MAEKLLPNRGDVEFDLQLLASDGTTTVCVCVCVCVWGGGGYSWASSSKVIFVYISCEANIAVCNPWCADSVAWWRDVTRGRTNCVRS
jgi:hypothetical protein